MPPPFCVCTLFACDIGYDEAVLWGAVVCGHHFSGVTVSFGWDTVSHEEDPAGYANWTPGEKLWLGILFHTEIDGLEPDTTYYYRARAQTEDYTGYGEEKSFRTPPGLGVITLPARDIKANQATLYGKTTGHLIYPKVKVSFGWDTESHAGDPDGYAHWAAPQNERVGDYFRTKLTGLTPETTYYFRARAERNGAIFYGQELSFTTSAELRVITLPARAIKSKEARLYGKVLSEFRSRIKVRFGWDTVSHADGPGEYDHWTPPRNVRPGEIFDFKLTNLEPDTTYYFCARGERDGSIAYGEELSFTTLKEKHGPWSWWEWLWGGW